MVSHCMNQARRRSPTLDAPGLESVQVGIDFRPLVQFGGRRFLKSVLAVLVLCTSLISQPLFALGLGEIDTRSALNERFVAEIELLDARGLSEAEVIVSLASAEDFQRVGVERFFFLTSLKFEVVPNARGRLVILASSDQPISEPYLNFLVEVLWPNGRLLKEYTVLLDPPTFTGTTAAPVAAPTRSQTASAPAQPARPAPQARGQVALPNRSSGQSQVKSQDFSGGTITTTQRDTMWSIGNRTLPSGNVTVQQNMLAIQRENPDAFINDNINLLKAGQVLNLPTPEEVAQLSPNEAVSELQRQNEDWRSGRSPSRSRDNDAVAQAGSEKLQAQIDATDSAVETTDDASESDASGVLQIVAADTDPTGIAETTGAGTEEGTALAVSSAERERLSALARQVDELTYQLDQKKAEADKLVETQKQVELKDRQIAQLQEALKNAQTQPQQPQNQSAQETTEWWQQPWVIFSGLGALALLLAGVMFKRRRENEIELDEDPAQEPSFALATPELDNSMSTQVLLDEELDIAELDNANLTEDLSSTLEESHAREVADSGADTVADTDLDDLFGADPDAAGASADGSELDSQQTDDVVGEADIYIAYGRYPQAISLLLGALDDDPAQHDVRLRLAEVYAETKDSEGFSEQADYLAGNCNDPAIREAVTELRSTLGLESGDDSADSAAPADDAIGEDSDITLDEGPIDFELDGSVSDGSASDSADAADDEFQLSEMSNDAETQTVDFDSEAASEIEFEEMDTATSEVSEEPASGDFELELDLDADDSSAAVGEDAEVSQDDLGGDLGIDFSTDTTEMLAATNNGEDDELLDEIERSLDELEADGMMAPSIEDDGDFSFSEEADTSATKLDLARAYIDMGDDDGAREILDEVIAEGDNTQKSEASELLNKL